MVKPLLPPKPKRKFRKYRPLTPREKRQRAIIKRFLKTFIPLAIIAYLLQNLPRLVDSGAKWLEDNILAHLGMRGEVVMYRVRRKRKWRRFCGSDDANDALCDETKSLIFTHTHTHT